MARPPSRQSFRDKFSKIFNIHQSGPIKATASTNPKSEEFLITPNLIKEISKESPLNQRLKTIRDLCDLVTTKRLEDNGIETIWLHISDLLDPKIPTESRHLVLNFIKCIIMGQYDRLGLMREHFFNILRNHSIFEDLPLRLDLFRALSDHGKRLLDFEEETGPFLLQWMPDVISYGRTCEFLNLLENVIKFNSCYLDDDIVAGLVQHTCTVCNRTDKEEDIDQSLKVLNAVIGYSCLPTQSLYHFITALCRTVSVPKFCEPSWKLMRNLLGTHLGHSAIYIMCCTMEDSDNTLDVILVRGAVFYVGMACWGSKRVQSLKHNFTSVLPSFLKALSGRNHVVAYEVTLSLQRLVTKYGKDIQPVTWDIILEIVEEIFKNIQMYAAIHEYLPDQLHDLLNTVETLHENKSFLGSASKLFAIVESFAGLRPERSVLSLIAFRAQSIHPTKADWIHNLQCLMERYFQKETRTSLREAALRVLSSVLSSTSHLYEDDLIELVVLPQLGGIAEDPDPRVRNMAVQLLVDVAQVCQTQRCQEILDIIRKVVMRPLHTTQSWSALSDMEGSSADTNTIPPRLAEDDTELVDIKTAVLGLLELLRTKLHRLPSTHAVVAFDLLVTHLQSHYAHKYVSEIACNIRALTFQCLLELRADNLCRLGLPNKDGQMRFSPYIICDTRMEMDITTKMSPTPSCASPPPSDRYCKTTSIPFVEAFKTLTICLIKETDWRVLLQVLNGLSKALQNKNLLLAASANIDRFCGTLCSMVEDNSRIRRIQQNSRQFNKADYYEAVFRVFTALVPYHNLLETRRQVDLVKCLELGLKLKCAQQCVDGLTLCVIEMQDTMVKILPSIILEMSKMSATPTLAIPVLEFLSSLIWFPRLYASFVEIQYMSIFAVALHYTNPFKFSLYIVSLAHHVIAMWFIKCRLPFRREFVNCITRGLRANAPRQVGDPYQNRMRTRRTSSLSEKPNILLGSSPKKKKASASSAKEEKKEAGPKQTTDEMLYELHQLLSETCMDMMARYTFSNCTTVPKRSPVTEFLLAGGQSQSWLLGNKLITITTSGGSSRLQKNGLCEKCCQLIDREKAATVVSDTSVSQSQAKMDAMADNNPVNASSEDAPLKKISRAKRVRSKSGNTHHIDSAGNMLPQKTTKKEDSAEVAHLSLLSSVKEDAPANKPFEAPPPTPSDKTKPRIELSQESLPSIASSHKSDASHEASKLASRETSKTGSPTSGAGSRSGSPTTSLEHSKETAAAARAALQAKFDAAAAKLSSSLFYQCNCWCIGWAEVYIRRPTGITSWFMRLQNGGSLLPVSEDFPLADVSTLLLRNRELDVDVDMIPSEEEGSCDSSIGDCCELDETQEDGQHCDEVVHQNESYYPRRPSLLSRSSNIPIITEEDEEEDDSDENFDKHDFITSPVDTDIVSSPLHDGMPFHDASLTHDPAMLLDDFDFGDSLHFHQPELGLSPMGPGKPYGLGADDARGAEYAKELRHCLTFNDLSGLIPQITRTNSAPDILCLVESAPKHPDPFSTSPRTVAMNLKQQSANGPSSYTETSELERKYQEDSVFRRESHDFNSDGIDTDVVSAIPFSTTRVETGLVNRGQETISGHATVKQMTRTSGDKVQISESHTGPVRGADSNQVKETHQGVDTNPATVGVPKDIPSTHVAGVVQSAQSGQIPPTTQMNTQTTTTQQSGQASQQQQVTGHQSTQIGGYQQQKDANVEPMTRPRGHTISGGISPSNQPITRQRGTGTFSSRDSKSGLSPSFVFLQLYYSPMFSDETERPITIPTSQVATRAVKVLDRIPPYDTHKIGVLYVGPGQANDESAILSNVYGSSRYVEFLQGLGKLISLKKDMSSDIYTGGLDHGADGKFAYWWHDDIMQVIFHVSTLMPNKDVDPNCNAKKLHIGNDFVSIVYNESNEPYKLGTIKGQFNFAEIVIEPLDNDCNLVTVQAKTALEAMIGSRGARMISNNNLALLVRQVALHANLASQIFQSQQRATPADAYTSNWLERLKKVRHIRQKVQQMVSSNLPTALLASRQHEMRNTGNIRKNSVIEDFTDYA